MKDIHVLGVTKVFNISDYDISPYEICWNNVKMTSSKWITCCHRRMVTSESSRLSVGSTSGVSNGSPALCRPPAKPSGRHSEHLSLSSANSYSSHSNSSPKSISSGFELSRKSSISSSSETSNNSHTEFKSNVMKHSASSFDLTSSPRPNHLPRSYDDCSMLPQTIASSVQSTITLISPFDCFLINCETNVDTNCAQISPELDVIAISNEYWIAFYSVRTNQCLATLQFPDKCIYWTWITGETIAIITENEVYHWRLTNTELDSNYIQRNNSLRVVFPLDTHIREHQIVSYVVDPIFGYWGAITALYLESDGEIGGLIQIYSHALGQSQCIEAHCCTFTAYQFEDSHHSSTLLIAAKRESSRAWKLHVIELGTAPGGATRRSHRVKTQQLTMHVKRRLSSPNVTGHHRFDDIPTQIVCDNHVGLIYLLSKYGWLYICDLESGVPLYCDSLSQWSSGCTFFSLTYDPKSRSLMTISRNGQVLTVKVSLTHLVADIDTAKVQSKVTERIGRMMHECKTDPPRQQQQQSEGQSSTCPVEVYAIPSVTITNGKPHPPPVPTQDHKESQVQFQDDLQEEVTRL